MARQPSVGSTNGRHPIARRPWRVTPRLPFHGSRARKAQQENGCCDAHQSYVVAGVVAHGFPSACSRPPNVTVIGWRG